MTKQRKTECIPDFLALAWGPRAGGNVPMARGKVVHVTRKMMANDADAIDMALLEQAFAIQGATSIASLLAWRLRQPSPNRAALNGIARMLDPSEDGHLKLKVVRNREGKTATRYINDATIAKAVKKDMEARGNKHGDQIMAVKKVAKLFGVSKATVLKAIRSK